MTTILGFVDKKNSIVYMGGDSQSTSGSEKIVSGIDKVFKKDGFLIGVSGSFRSLQLVQHMTFPEWGEDSKLMTYLINKFVPSVRTVFKEEESSYIDKVDMFGGTILVGKGSELCCVSCDYSVDRESSGYMCVGSGGVVASGAMYAMNEMQVSGLHPADRVKIALNAASSYDIYTSSPYVILSSLED